MVQDDTPRDDDRLLNEGEAAQLLTISARTLQAWRCAGEGPHFVKIGRAVRYWRSALLEWAGARR
jgi:predicted DNA-binding transcriptional regulator AlpA